MPSMIGSRLRNAWNAFRSRDPTQVLNRTTIGEGSYTRQDRVRMFCTSERSTIVSVYNRIALDVASVNIRHVRLDQNGRFSEEIVSGLNNILSQEANTDQTSRAFIQDIVMSMFDEGAVAVIPTDTDVDPTDTSAFEILSMRTGKIIEWFPQHVKVRVYNEETGKREDLILKKSQIAIIENPLYSVMNEPNSTLKRLIRKLAILDAIDEQSGAGKLDLIIQLPYVIKTEARKQQAEDRRKDIEVQLSGSKYGIAYTDGTERITQLNRPAENNLMTQITYLTSMLYSQLGLTEEVFTGKADETVMLNYINRTVTVILNAIIDEFKRKFLSKTARTQKQSIMYFRDAFGLVPASQLATIMDIYTRNEILSSNEARANLGYRPSDDPKADKLVNKNIAPTNAVPTSMDTEMDPALEDPTIQVNQNLPLLSEL